MLESSSEIRRHPILDAVRHEIGVPRGRRRRARAAAAARARGRLFKHSCKELVDFRRHHLSPCSPTCPPCPPAHLIRPRPQHLSKALSTGVHWCLHLHRIDGDREYAEFMYLPIGLQTLITSKGVVADSGGKSTCSF
ncbi:hypothetical protein EJB05_52678 [Eragrostis curvula]|uniref:Uncharacterized protein n=1 Tax=Eragrostis curvula TaxID=38414 RepID=A0A5J9SSC8_9POAL|nr:hypothetical protein EJB05_52678 [Eragrostis curvula]